MGMKEDGPKRPNKKLLYYYGIILLITILRWLCRPWQNGL